MKLSSETTKILKDIRFAERYRELALKHQHELDDMFGGYDNTSVLEVLASLGRKATYNKKENFFKIVLKKGEYRFQFNISLKYGCCEFIWGLRKGNDKIILGPWGFITQLMGIEDDNLKRASFKTYDELKDILSEALCLYDEFYNQL